MAKLDSKVWWGLKRDLQNYALGITEQPLTVVEIPRSEGQLGYTAKGKGIHLANDHPLMDSMTTKEKVACNINIPEAEICVIIQCTGISKNK